MLVATPGQTKAYVLHNSGSGNTSGATNNAAANTTAPSTTSSLVTTKKQHAVLSKLSSSKETPKCVNNNNVSSSTTTRPNQTVRTGHSTTHQNSFSFHLPASKKSVNSFVKNSSISSSTALAGNPIRLEPEHSLKNSIAPPSHRPPSFLSTLKDTVQKALVNTASSLSRNGNSRTTHATPLNSSSTTNKCSNTYSSSLHVTSAASSSSALSAATSKNSSSTFISTLPTASSSSCASSSTTLPLTVARKKFAQAIATHPKLHTIPPTTLHRYPEERQKASSTDSLQKEMCHFKPIRTVPTTPWKSGSKSRGSSLRFPKANLATNNCEFNLKSDCDVNNRRKKHQTKLNQNDLERVANEDGEDSDNNDEQENKSYHELFTPKPSSLHLCARFMRENHQSAFVCVIANLMNIQPAGSATTPSSVNVKDDTALKKSKKPRVSTRSKRIGSVATKATSPAIVPVRELFVRNKKFKSPLPPPPIPAKRSRLSTSSARSQRTVAIPISNIEMQCDHLLGNTAPSRRRLKVSKSSMNNNEQLPSAEVRKETVKLAGQLSSRKRKATPTADGGMIASIRTPSSASALSMPPTPSSRSKGGRSVRLTAESYANNIYFKYPELSLSRANLQVLDQRNGVCFSPPLTRSRLKQFLSEQQTQRAKATQPTPTPTMNAKKRKL